MTVMVRFDEMENPDLFSPDNDGAMGVSYKGSKEITLQVTIQSLIFEMQECRVITFVDMTHLKLLVQAEQQNMKMQIRESTVSHELLAPLRCIVRLSKDLIEPADERDRATFMMQNPLIIYNTGKLILAQMNDILDNRMLDRPDQVCQTRPCDIKELIEETVQIFKAQAVHQNLNLVQRLPPNTVVIETDAVRVQQILINLLSNALKFSPKGSIITIALETIKDELNQSFSDSSISVDSTTS